MSKLQEKDKAKDQLPEEISALQKRTQELQDLESRYKSLEEELQKTKNELETQGWGLEKTNQAIKVLYKELEKKNKELQKLDQLKSDFVSAVSHELRTPLTTIREAISQILDGILGKITAEQREFLSICLEDVDRLKRIIDNLLDIAKLEAGKIRLKREEADVVILATAVSAAFYPKAKSRNLEIREDFPAGKAVAYVDKDAIIQVFTNLVGNAFKFTQSGYVDISVRDEPAYVECSVSDTGKGISEEDLPKVFAKFQQFGQAGGPGEKGTGLGLSISKGLIELHGGKIWAESKIKAGTKFIFRLPKYTAKELFKEYVTKGLKETTAGKGSLSVLVFSIKGVEGVDSEKMNAVLQNVDNLARRQADAVVKDAQVILVVLPRTQKEEALKVAERMQGKINEYLSKEKIRIEISSWVLSYPEDGETEKQICAKVDQITGG